MYGDTYKETADAVEGIGNNVSMEYEIWISEKKA